jgi:hypothetical protein
LRRLGQGPGIATGSTRLTVHTDGDHPQRAGPLRRAEVRPDGQRVVAAVDGAMHLTAGQWWSDQDRQNEIVIGGALVLRFPSFVVREDPDCVAGQLRQVLLC